jgi:hypothetical protein
VTEKRETKNNNNDEKPTGNTTLAKWIYLWLGLVAIAAIVLIVFLPHKKTGPPRISFSEVTWDFGITPNNSRISHVFWIKNIGGDTLRIIKVEPG